MTAKTRAKNPITFTNSNSSKAVLGFALFLGCLGICGCPDSAQPKETVQRADPQAGQPSGTAGPAAILVGAGDVAGCRDLDGARATARLLEKVSGTVFVAGDLAYEKGSAAEFKNCYDATWGEFKARTRPSPGNHEYVDPNAKGYFEYWGEQAGPVGKGYYSYELGTWHIVVLNTNCLLKTVGGCGVGSPEETWLKQDLAAHADACILAYGHHTLFSSGFLKSHAIHPELRTFWQDLYAAHAALVLAGHEHSYERFAPQDPDGRADPERGIREIVVGTGGRSHGVFGFRAANSEVRNTDTYGVLKLTLSPGRYNWQFLPEEGKTFSDSGSGSCPTRATVSK